MNRTRGYHIFLVVIFTLVWIWAVINPIYRFDWFMENVLIFIFVPIILLLAKYFKLSNISYTFITLFLILHVIGSHYTYAEVPFGYFLQNLLGSSRNMYDRLVHFAFGLLWFYPLREVLMRVSKTKGIWAYYFPLDIVVAFSAIFELFEWGAVMVSSPTAGMAFLGAQGDIWDAQKDMFMALIGAIVTMIATLLVNLKFNRKLKKELKDSLKIPKGDKPLGEVRLMEMLRNEERKFTKRFKK